MPMKKHYRNHHSFDMHIVHPEKVIARTLEWKFVGYSRPVIVAIGGPGGTGKSTFARALATELSDARVLGLDDYKTPRQHRAGLNVYGAHPDANEFLLLERHLETLRAGNPIEKPVYCREHGCARTTEPFVPARFIVAEGEVATYPQLHGVVDFALFIDAHWQTQLATRINRDIAQRGYTPEKAIATFLYSNLREFPRYGAESKNWADLHLHCGDDYALRIDAVCAESATFLHKAVEQVAAQ